MKVKISIPSLPDGTEISIPNLGVLLINDRDVEVSSEDIKMFELRSGKTFSNVIKGKKFSVTKPAPPKDVDGADK